MINLLNGYAIGLGTNELLIILGIAILLFGGAKIPQLMRGIGRGVGEMQEGLKEGKRKFEEGMKDDGSDEADKGSTTSVG